MHIDTTSHEHGASGKVYTYEGDFDVGGDAITWKAWVSQGGGRERSFSGTVNLTSPAMASLAEQAVRDDILKSIDTFDDKSNADPVAR